MFVYSSSIAFFIRLLACCPPGSSHILPHNFELSRGSKFCRNKSSETIQFTKQNEKDKISPTNPDPIQLNYSLENVN